METKTQPSIRTLRLKVKAEGYAWLNAAAIEVNQPRGAGKTPCISSREE